MVILRLKGDDEWLYRWVGQLVMNKDVLRYNLDYPYRTSADYCWFIAVEVGKVIGFVPVELKQGKAKINNYYIAGDDEEIFAALLQRAVEELSVEYRVEAVAQNQHVRIFEQNGFAVAFFWKKYAKMVTVKDEKKRV